MDILVKVFYSLFFGTLALLLFLLFSAQVANVKKLEIGCLIVLVSTVAVNASGVTSRFVPPSEVWELVVFDFSIPILYTMMQRQASTINSSATRILKQDISSLHLQKSRNHARIKLFISMTYLYQLVSIWLLTEHYLMEPNQF